MAICLHTILFQTSQFNTSFSKCHLFALSLKIKQFYFDPQIGLYQVLLLRTRVGLELMAMKGYSAFPKAPAFLEPLHQIVYCHYRTLIGRRPYSTAEMLSVYSIALADQPLLIRNSLNEWVKKILDEAIFISLQANARK